MGTCISRVACAILLLIAFTWLSENSSAADFTEWSVKPGTARLKAKPTALSRGTLVLADEAGGQHAVLLSNLPVEEAQRALIEIVGSSVVVVDTKDVLDEPAGVGSGFVFRKDGLILTNYHVVRGAGSIEVEFRGGNAPVPADCLAVDRENDVAVLKVAQLPPDVHVLELSVRERPKQGDGVWTIGHPERLVNTVSWGQVNAVRSSMQLPEELRKELGAPADSYWVQTDAVLAHGSSGGPLLNQRGEALGMNTFIVGPQLGFALHLMHARGAFEKARAATPMTLPIPPAKGESAMAWTSREIAPLLKEMRETLERTAKQVARLPQEQQQQAVRESYAGFRTRFMQIAESDPSSWPAFQALLIASGLCSDESDDSQQCLARIYKHLGEHHIEQTDLTRMLAKVSVSPGEGSREFCQMVLDRSPHAEVRAQAVASLALERLTWLQSPTSIDLASIQAARDEVEKNVKRLETEFAEETVFDQPVKEFGPELTDHLANTRVGLPAAEIEGIDHEGKTFKLSEFKGKVVVLDFFADWCPWCRKMYAGERQMVEKYKDRPFVLLGINTDNQKRLLELVEAGTVTWRTWADGESGPIAANWEVDSYPSMYVVDHNGIVRMHVSGAAEEVLARTVESLVGEAETPAAK